GRAAPEPFAAATRRKRRAPRDRAAPASGMDRDSRDAGGRSSEDSDRGQRPRIAARTADGAQSRRRPRQHAGAAGASLPVLARVLVLQPRRWVLRYGENSLPRRARRADGGSGCGMTRIRTLIVDDEP